MENYIRNRKAGRPTKAELAARPEATPLIPAEVKIVSVGCICPRCGRGMVPKVLRGTNDIRYCRCTLCGGEFRQFRKDGSDKLYVQPI